MIFAETSPVSWAISLSRHFPQTQLNITITIERNGKTILKQNPPEPTLYEVKRKKKMSPNIFAEWISLNYISHVTCYALIIDRLFLHWRDIITACNVSPSSNLNIHIAYLSVLRPSAKFF